MAAERAHCRPQAKTSWDLPIVECTPTCGHKTFETTGQLGFEAQQHFAYSPDLAFSDYNLFGSLKDALRGRGFLSEEAEREAVHKCLHDQQKTFFSNGIYQPVVCWKKCIEKGGNYAEK